VSIREWLSRPVLVGVVALVAIASVLGWIASIAAEGIPFSPVFGDSRIGPAFPERRGLTTGDRPAGEMDDMAAYAREGSASSFDPERVDPDVRSFYEQTGQWAMAYRVRWHPGFRLGASAAARVTSRIEQLNLPGPGDRTVHGLRSRFARVRSGVDPREDVRAWVRTDPETGEAVFVALYGSHESDGERFVNIAAPLPGANLSTVLRIDHLDVADRTATGVELTTGSSGETASRQDHPGLYLNTPAGAFALPMQQRFRVWPVGAAEVPEGSQSEAPEAIDSRARLVATHEMWVAGRQFLTITYAMWPRDARGE
jgi:hypothetical protein